MKKVVYHGIRDIRVEEVEEIQPGKGEVKIKIKYCGICGSDLHEYLDRGITHYGFVHRQKNYRLQEVVSINHVTSP
jgi:threonine dehydrogenase-like Zn-dependent dehydrogenase